VRGGFTKRITITCNPGMRSSTTRRTNSILQRPVGRRFFAANVMADFTSRRWGCFGSNRFVRLSLTYWFK
jgi:hypothetical protein